MTETPKHRYTELTINGEDRSEEVRSFAQWIGLEAATSGRHSTRLVVELFVRSVLVGQLNPAKVVREIQALEGKGRGTSTKPPQPFKHPPLRGLWHKHYVADGISTMARNLLNGLRKDGLPEIQRRVREAESAGEERYFTTDDIGAITHDAVIANWQRRSSAKELTGEWIIYAQHGGNNYYLCLGQHDSGDDVLRANIEICIAEFPFLAETLHPLPRD